jgi:hypothetical protein
METAVDTLHWGGSVQLNISYSLSSLDTTREHRGLGLP